MKNNQFSINFDKILIISSKQKGVQIITIKGKSKKK